MGLDRPSVLLTASTLIVRAIPRKELLPFPWCPDSARPAWLCALQCANCVPIWTRRNRLNDATADQSYGLDFVSLVSQKRVPRGQR